MSRILVVGDLHLPAVHPGYLSFVRDLRSTYKCDEVVFIGDCVDWHSISFHARHPEAPGPKDEYELAKHTIIPWVRTFPRAKVCVGNHDARIVRLAETVNIPAPFLRDYRDIWQTPDWNWADNHIIDDVYYFHGTGTGGVHPAYTSMGKLLMSVCQGHIHSAAGIKWRANPQRRIFGLDTGCGVDDKAIAFAYGATRQIRSMLSAAVVLDGIPQHIIMPCGSGERYHKSKFTKGGRR